LQGVRIQAPAGRQCLHQTQRRGLTAERHALAPGLVVEVAARVDAGRAGHGVAQHAVAGHAGLALVAGFDLGLQQGVGRRLPVAGQGQQAALAAGVACGWVQPLVGGVQAQADMAFGAEALADVDGPQHRAGLAPLDACLAVVAVRALDNQVDQATGRAGAGLQAAGALQQFEPFLVVQCDRRFGIDGQAVTPVVVTIVQCVTTRRQAGPVAVGVVGLAQAGVGLGQGADGRDAGIGQLLLTDDAGLQRGLRQWRVAEAGHPGAGQAASADHHRGLRPGRAERPGAGRGRQRQRGGSKWVHGHPDSCG
jgi:hypothetical protein